MLKNDKIMKTLIIKSISMSKNSITVTLYEKNTKNIIKYSYENNKNNLNLIFKNIIKKVWDCYPSANHGMWKYLQALILEYCKNNNIYISNELNTDISSPIFELFLNELNKCISAKEKFILKTKNGFYLEKKDTSFNFKLNERKLNAYKFTYSEKELFKIINKDNPIYSNILIE